MLDYNSLLLAVGFAGLGLAATILTAWFSSRTDRFMLIWVGGAVLIVMSVFAYSAYIDSPVWYWRTLAATTLMVGLSFVVGAASQFRTGKPPTRQIGIASTLSLALVVPLVASRYDGVGFIAFNLVAGGLLLIAAHNYWRCQVESPSLIFGLATLYGLVGASFLLCAAVLMAKGQVILAGPPNDWAENLNLIVSIVGLSGIGALSLTLKQGRLARSHRHDALTDMQTGLCNRRALFEAYRDRMIAARTAVIVFDLDAFKNVNDRFGHAIGDKVLIRFASVIRRFVREEDCSARIGGEEFAVILEWTTPTLATMVAERIRESFAREVVMAGEERVICTTSAGVAYIEGNNTSLDAALRRADEALYIAKRSGRNRVVGPSENPDVRALQRPA